MKLMTKNTGEVWKTIEGHERYEVSNMGEVRSFVRRKEGKILKPRMNRGYARVWIDGKNYAVHRLVAMAFCEGYREGLEVNHINEIKHDNRAENLEWVTRWENVHHGTGLERARAALRKPILMFSEDGGIINRFSCIEEAAKELGLSISTISRYINGKSKPSKEYTLRKEEDMPNRGLVEVIKPISIHNGQEQQAA